MELSNHTILITGGASGIGLGLAERFWKENNQVIICGRRGDLLERTVEKFPGMMMKQVDLSKETERVQLHEWILEEHPKLDVLINNAGIQNWMNLDDEDFYMNAEAEIVTNILAPLHLVKLFSDLPKFRVVMNVTSGLSFVPLVKVPVYSATKAFLHSFTLSIRALLKPQNIEVIEIIPPALNTDLGGPGIHDSAPPVSDFIEAIFEQLAEGKDQLTFGFSETVSQAGMDVLDAVFKRLNPL